MAAKKADLKKAIESEEGIAAKVQKEKVAYRESYRQFERTRAEGETYESNVLQSGREVKGVKILKVFPDRVSFATEYGSSAIDWKDLPDSWSKRFQAGEGELEAFETAAAQKRAARQRHFAQMNASKVAELKSMRQKKRLSDVTARLLALEQDISVAKRELGQTERQLASYQSRSRSTSLNGNGVSTSYRNSIETAKANITRLKRSLAQAESLQAKLAKEKQGLEAAVNR